MIVSCGKLARRSASSCNSCTSPCNCCEPCSDLRFSSSICFCMPRMVCSLSWTFSCIACSASALARSWISVLLLAHALFDGQVQLALGIVQLPPLPHGFGLRFLRFLKLDRALIGELGLLFQQLILVMQIERELGRRLLPLFLRHPFALALQALRDFRVDRFLGHLDRLGLRAHRRLALGDLGLLLAQLRLAVALRRLDQRRGKRLGELDLSPAVRTNDRRFQARVLPKHSRSGYIESRQGLHF